VTLESIRVALTLSLEQALVVLGVIARSISDEAISRMGIATPSAGNDSKKRLAMTEKDVIRHQSYGRVKSFDIRY